MHEIEFLPEWYPVLRRRRGLAVTQAWATAVLMGSICLWGVAAHHRVMAHESRSGQLQQEMLQTRSELKMLDEQLRLKVQLQQQELIQAKVGLQVDITRLVGELGLLMGPDMALLDFSAETEETLRKADSAAANNQRSSGGDASANSESGQMFDRRLKVRLAGVAPSDVDVANFLAGLTNKSFLDQVAMTYAKDRMQSGRVMREFEVTFLINLNTPTAE